MLAVENYHEKEDYLSNIEPDDSIQTMDMPVDADHEKKKRFEKLFIPLIDRLYNMALRITRNPDDADDLVQETYLKAYRFFNNFQVNTNARAWIMTIMMNTFRTRYRKSQKEPTKSVFAKR